MPAVQDNPGSLLLLLGCSGAEIGEWVRTQALSAGFSTIQVANTIPEAENLAQYALVVVDESAVEEDGLPGLMRRLRPTGEQGPGVCLLVSTLTPEALQAGWEAGVDLHLIKSATVSPTRSNFRSWR